MKKLFLLVLVAMVSTASFAQMSWNVKAGVNMSNVSDMEADMKFGYQVGVGMEYAFDDMWSLRPSLMFITKGCKAGEDGYEAKLNPMYLQIPIMAAAGFNISDNMRFIVNAGPYVGFGIGGKYSEEFDGEKEEADIFGDEGLDGKRFEFGVGVGVGLEISKFIVSLDGMFGLTKVFDSEDVSPKNTTIALSVGYKF